VTEFDSVYYENLQGSLRGLLILVADQLPESTVSLLNELIDANECGVAVEILSEALANKRATLAAESLRHVAELVAAMGLDQANVERLRPLVNAPERSENSN
jgi:hypothetical protein